MTKYLSAFVLSVAILFSAAVSWAETGAARFAFLNKETAVAVAEVHKSNNAEMSQNVFVELAAVGEVVHFLTPVEVEITVVDRIQVEPSKFVEVLEFSTAVSGTKLYVLRLVDGQES